MFQVNLNGNDSFMYYFFFCFKKKFKKEEEDISFSTWMAGMVIGDAIMAMIS